MARALGSFRRGLGFESLTVASVRDMCGVRHVHDLILATLIAITSYFIALVVLAVFV